jgi:hypothetical protein
MALFKSITLPNGIGGNYIRVADSFELNRRNETVTAHVSLFKDESHAMTLPNYPLAVIGLVELNSEKFNQYLGRDALLAAGGNIVGQLYLAAKSETVRALGPLTELSLSDASDV